VKIEVYIVEFKAKWSYILKCMYAVFDALSMRLEVNLYLI